MGSTAISQSQPFSSENISKALLIIGIGVFTYLGVSKAVHRVAKLIFEKNSSKPQLATVIISSIVVLWVVKEALFWKSSKVQMNFVVILLGYVVERVAFYIWGKSDSSKTVFPRYMWDMVVTEVKNEENDSMIGHEAPIENISTLLHRSRKTNAILLGLPGVGKTTIVKNFAYKIGKKLLSEHYFFTNIKLVKIDVKTLLADMAWTETIEDHVKQIVDIGTKYPQFVFFIDRDDTLGADGLRLDYHINLLKRLLPYTESGRLRILAAVTLEEYKMYILPEDSLTRFLNLVGVKSPTPPHCFNMLRCRYLKFNQSGDIKVSDQGIAAAIFFSEDVPNRYFPDKAIDLIEHVLSRVDLEKPIDQDDERVSVVIDVHQIVKSALAQYQWRDSPEELVRKYKEYINGKPDYFTGLRDGDSLWVSQPQGQLLLTSRA